MGNNPFGLFVAGKIIYEDEKSPAKLQGVISYRTDAPEGADKRRNIESMIRISLEALREKDETAYLVFMAFGVFSMPQATEDLLAFYLFPQKDGKRADLSQGLRLLRRRALLEERQGEIDMYQMHSLAYEYTKDRANEEQRLGAAGACLEYSSTYQFDAERLQTEIDNLLGAADLAAAKQWNEVLIGIMQRLATGSENQQAYVDVKGHSSKLLELLGEAIARMDKSDTSENNTIRLNLLAKLANGYYEYEMYDEALKYYREAVLLAAKLGQIGRQAGGLIRIMDILIGDAQFDEAERTLKEVDTLARVSGNNTLIARLEHAWGYFLQARGEDKKAREHFQTALELLKDAPEGVYPVLFINLLSLGTCETDLGNFDEAIKHHQAGLVIGQHYGVARYIGLSHGSLAVAYCWKGNYGEAKKHVDEGLKASEGGYDKKTANQIRDFGRYMAWRETSLEPQFDTGTLHWVGWRLIEIAEALLKVTEYKQARKYLTDAREIFSVKPKNEILLKRIAFLILQTYPLKRKKSHG
jgi:tetratricopeptide (TPR) repeat protein